MVAPPRSRLNPRRGKAGITLGSMWKEASKRREMGRMGKPAKEDKAIRRPSPALNRARLIHCAELMIRQRTEWEAGPDVSHGAAADRELGLDPGQAGLFDRRHGVWLVEGHAGRKAGSMVLACHRDVYCDMLQGVIEETYDRAIEEYNQVFIAL